MTNLFRPQGAFGWFSYTTSRDTIEMRVWVVKTQLLQAFSAREMR